MSELSTQGRLPEEEELRRKQAELEEMERLLVERELELATARSELLHFQHKYFEAVGRLYVELDELHAKRARQAVAASPEDPEIKAEAEEAANQARQSRAEYEEHVESAPARPKHQHPTKELRELYRRLAKRYHPDLADSPDEARRRTEYMAQINSAYAEGDLDRLKQLEAELAAAPEAVSGADIGSRLIRIIRKIHQVERRLREIEDELGNLRTSDLWKLYSQWKQGIEDGRDILEELAANLRTQIDEARGTIT